MAKATSRIGLGLAMFSAQLFLSNLIICDDVHNDIYFINSDESIYSKNRISCKGNVVIMYYEKIIAADEISYDKHNDVVFANGNVIMKDEKQNVCFLDSLKVCRKLESGEGKNLRINLQDRSRLAAKYCSIKGGKFELRNAIYTPCYECVAFDELTWRIKAAHITLDQEKDAEYEDAQFELLGKNILYIPHFSHPSPKIRRKTGFLTPKISVSSVNGLSILPRYFINISPYQEVELKPIITSKIGGVAWAAYRTRFKNGEFSADASLTGTASVRDNDVNESSKVIIDKIRRSDYRGHLFSKTRYEIDDTWRCMLDINIASDRYYLKRFPFIKQIDRILQSNATIEGFDDRNYTSARLLMFQSDSSNIILKVTPVIERNISVNFFHGTLDIDALFVNMNFSENRSAQKLNTNISWSKDFLLPGGHILDFKGLAALKTVNVSEKQRSEYSSYFSVSPQMIFAWKWPLLFSTNNYQTVFTPIIGFILANNKRYDDVFEDQFCEINDINFLEGSRAVSPYNIDYGKRVCYGTKVSFYRKDGRNIGYFTVGRSTELTAAAKKPDATGMKYKNSNIIGSADVFLSEEITLFAKGSYSTKRKKWLKVETGLKFSNETFDADLMVFDGRQCSYNPFWANVSELPDVRKTQVYRGSMFDIGWKVSRRTKLKSGVIFGTEENKLMKYNFGLEFTNECTQMEISIERTNYCSGDIKQNTALKLTIHLKNLGS
jgi:LPS-assembly protein